MREVLLLWGPEALGFWSRSGSYLETAQHYEPVDLISIVLSNRVSESDNWKVEWSCFREKSLSFEAVDFLINKMTFFRNYSLLFSGALVRISVLTLCLAPPILSQVALSFIVPWHATEIG